MLISQSFHRIHNTFFTSVKCTTFFRQVHRLNPFFIFSKKCYNHIKKTQYLTYYTKTHEYIKWKDEKNCTSLELKKEETKEVKTNVEKKAKLKEGIKCRIGISKYGTEKLGEVVYVDIMHKINDKVKKGECIATIESVKSVGDVYTPIGGVITDVNKKIMDEVNLINIDSEEEGWLIEMEVDNINEKEVLNFSEYKKLCEEEERIKELQNEHNETNETDFSYMQEKEEREERGKKQ